MNRFLTDEQIGAYAESGYVSGVDVLTPAEVAALSRTIIAFERQYSDQVSWAFDIKCNLVLDWVADAGMHPRMLDAVEDLIGPNILMTDAVFRIKEPGSTVIYDWHQDSARIQVEPCFVIGFLSISAATTENGCLQVIPGTHHAVEPFSVVGDSPGQQLRRVARVKNPDTCRAIPLELAPGQAAFFSGNLIHASGPNHSPARRVSILYDYTAAHARQSVGRGSGQLVRGTDSWGYFGHEPLPAPGFTPENAAGAVGSSVPIRKILSWARASPESPCGSPTLRAGPMRSASRRIGRLADIEGCHR